MLLVIDVGNTNTVLGVFEGKDLCFQWRLSTNRGQTADEYGILIRNLFTLDAVPFDRITGIMIASVVPTLDPLLEEMAETYFHIKTVFLGPGTRTGMAIRYDNPLEVGADRIADAVAAFEKYGGPCIVVDFGTGINFDVVSEKGEYLGGAIAPGIGIAAEALFQRAARLPRVEIREPQKVTGTNTVASMQS
ncbi:MAG TPA: type III pantothenate kinase, partial [Terracidiphilus sp.]|nr:type III pantothenate kinase [Terracidiphilus sp.]